MKNFIWIIIFTVIGSIMGLFATMFFVYFLIELPMPFFETYFRGNLPAGLVALGYGTAIYGIIFGTIASKRLIYNIPISLNSLRFVLSFILIFIVAIFLIFWEPFWCLIWHVMGPLIVPIVILGKTGLHKSEKIGTSIFISLSSGGFLGSLGLSNFIHYFGAGNLASLIIDGFHFVPFIGLCITLLACILLAVLSYYVLSLLTPKDEDKCLT